MTKLLIVLSLLLTGCVADGIREGQTTNSEVGVTVLFDYDGCRVYRFQDGGRYIYFARCGGNLATNWSESHYNTATKTTQTTHYRVETVSE